jgi:DNA primase catalytic subunit
MMDLKKVYAYYSREDVQNFLLEISKNREVVGVFRNGNFSQRPNVLVYPNDILAMVKTGVVEFHGSLERWSQPMNLRQDNYEKLRTGWDLILDIDCEVFEHGKIAAESFIWALKQHGLKNISLKFTGGSGFHIGIPWESLPKSVDYKPTIALYPELARKIIIYLKHFVYEHLEKKFFSKFSPEEIAQQINKPLGKIITDDGLNVYEIVDIDPVLISPRHLFRLPYSLNGKTFLISLPIKPENIKDFEREMARPSVIKVEEKFLQNWEEKEAELLIAEAVDWYLRYKKIRESKTGKDLELKKPVSVENFPPCIKNILQGLADGRKRSVFILINFLRSCKWTWEEVDKFIKEWNTKNKPPLSESYIRSQIRWHRNKNKDVLPPNCSNQGYYKSFGVCTPDEICEKIKNPVNYVFRTTRRKETVKRKRKAK